MLQLSSASHFQRKDILSLQHRTTDPPAKSTNPGYKTEMKLEQHKPNSGEYEALLCHKTSQPTPASSRHDQQQLNRLLLLPISTRASYYPLPAPNQSTLQQQQLS